MPINIKIRAVWIVKEIQASLLQTQKNIAAIGTTRMTTKHFKFVSEKHGCRFNQRTMTPEVARRPGFGFSIKVIEACIIASMKTVAPIKR